MSPVSAGTRVCATARNHWRSPGGITTSPDVPIRRRDASFVTTGVRRNARTSASRRSSSSAVTVTSWPSQPAEATEVFSSSSAAANSTLIAPLLRGALGRAADHLGELGHHVERQVSVAPEGLEELLPPEDHQRHWRLGRDGRRPFA